LAGDIRTQIDLDATPDAVWAVLVDFARYDEWNPMMTGVSADLREGGSLAFTLHSGGQDSKVSAVFRDVQPGKRLSWGGGFRWLVQVEHYLEIRERPGGCTLLHGETFGGLGGGLVPRFLNLQRSAYEAMNAALAERLA
jgi:hypothetical protein